LGAPGDPPDAVCRDTAAAKELKWVAEISPTNVVRMNLTISGAGTTGPDPLLNVASNSSPSWAQMYTAQWVRKNIPAGSSPTVTLQFVMDGSFGFGGFRTMSIDVMNGLL
jgi:hypothetical protein